VIQSISALQFLVNVVALVGAVITVGTLVANASTVLHQQWKENRNAFSLGNPKDFSSVVLS